MKFFSKSEKFNEKNFFQFLRQNSLLRKFNYNLLSRLILFSEISRKLSKRIKTENKQIKIQDFERSAFVLCVSLQLNCMTQSSISLKYFFLNKKI